MVDYNKQEIIFCPNITGLDNKGIVSTLNEHFKINVTIDTSARCMALGEKLFGCGKEIDNQLFISIGHSISSGMITNSQLFRGADGFSGEIGHIQVSQSNDMCTCGNSGCLELYATIPMIIIKAMKELQDTDIYSPLKQFCPDLFKINMETIVKAYHLGDKTIMKIIQEVGKKLGVSISSVINLFNPSLVIFGGGLIGVFPEIIDEVTRFVYQNSLTPSTSKIVFKKSNLDELSPIIGSACQIINSTFPPCTV